MKHANSKTFALCIGLLCLCFNLKLSAQTEKGSQFVGGDFDIDFNSFPNASNVNVTLESRLEYAYFIEEGLSLGLKLPIEYASAELIPDDFWRVSTGLSPFIQWYPGRQEKNIRFFVFAQTGIRLTRRASFIFGGQLVDPFREAAVDWVSGGGIGLSAFVTSHVALTATAESNYGVNLSGEAFTDFTRTNLSFGVKVFLSPKS